MTLARAVVAALLLVAADASAQPIIGSSAPPLGLRDLDGKSFALDGKVAVVDFFATWCGPCHEAMRALDAIARAEPALELVVVDVGEPAETVRAFFAANPLPPGAHVVLDPSGDAARRWGQRRFPTSFVVDASGVIRHINRGYGPGYPARMQHWVHDVLTKR